LNPPDLQMPSADLDPSVFGRAAVFAEPWQAQAFALAVRLSATGQFSWKEWTEALGSEFRSAYDRGEPDDGSHYYEHWLAALERLVMDKGLVSAEQLVSRKNAWIDAYLHTPHGQPVHLRKDPCHDLPSGDSGEAVS
jgi:nitrile hydratase accessory protein